MQIPGLETKRIFLIASRDEKLVAELTRLIEKHIKQPTIFVSADGTEALFKANNVFPHVALIDADLEKTNGFAVVDKLLRKAGDHSISVILLSSLPDRDCFIDEVITGQVQFLSHALIDTTLPQCLIRALNCISLTDDSSYHIRFLSSEEVLFEEGEKAKSVFIVKSGELQAIKRANGQSVVLGNITPGEFVGEMAHINNENRYATVRALTDCELIEIPTGTLDSVLFSKPLWAKALVSTLSKRLKISNSLLMNNKN